MSNDCENCKYLSLNLSDEPCAFCDDDECEWESAEEVSLALTTSKEIHDKLHVLYSQYNDLGEVLSKISGRDNPYTYELIQAKYNALAQEIESISKKEWREA